MLYSRLEPDMSWIKLKPDESLLELSYYRNFSCNKIWNFWKKLIFQKNVKCENIYLVLGKKGLTKERDSIKFKHHIATMYHLMFILSITSAIKQLTHKTYLRMVS
jgi:hypothetical protein